ncbi:hypothetical protein [Bacillus bombysepticus]|uniref:hypothetical protein n=1 Tax=Bacillus bombysepticus TaxID=658666 RepID=UPI003017D6C6
MNIIFSRKPSQLADIDKKDIALVSEIFKAVSINDKNGNDTNGFGNTLNHLEKLKTAEKSWEAILDSIYGMNITWCPFPEVDLQLIWKGYLLDFPTLLEKNNGCIGWIHYNSTILSVCVEKYRNTGYISYFCVYRGSEGDWYLEERMESNKPIPESCYDFTKQAAEFLESTFNIKKQSI